MPLPGCSLPPLWSPLTHSQPTVPEAVRRHELPLQPSLPAPGTVGAALGMKSTVLGESRVTEGSEQVILCACSVSSRIGINLIGLF